MLVNFDDHLFNHLFHLLDLRRNLNYIMLHLCVLKNALGTEHLAIILAVKFHLFWRVDVAEPNAGSSLVWVWVVSSIICLSHSHWQGSQNLIIDWKVLWQWVMSNLVVRAFNHLVLVKLFYAFETEGMSARQWYGLLVIMVVRLKTNAAFKNRFHVLSKIK